MSDNLPATTADPFYSFIERAMRDTSFDVTKLATLLEEHRKERQDARLTEFNRDMANCQSEMEPVLRTVANPAVRKNYAPLEVIDQQMRPIYTRHGFSVRFGSAEPPQAGWIRVTCTVAHNGGWSETHYLDSPVSQLGSQGGRSAMTPVQAVGSVVTYLRRYLIGMVFNIVTADVVGKDTDGEPLAPPDRPPPPSRPSGNGSGRDDGPWPIWLGKLDAALSAAQSVLGIEAIADKPEVVKAMKECPDWVNAEVNRMLSDAMSRVRAARIDSMDELPPIVGEDKAGA